MANISKIKVDGVTYDIEDTEARLGAIPTAVKMAMDTLFQKIAVKDDNTYTSEYSVIHAWATAVNLLSISAVYSQGDNVVFASDSLNSLKQNLTVTANWDDGTSSTLTDSAYELTGSLTTGRSIITASYQGKTATFTVTVSEGTDITPAYSGFVGSNGVTVSQVTNGVRLYSSSGTYKFARVPVKTKKGYSYKIAYDQIYTSGNISTQVRCGSFSNSTGTGLDATIAPRNSNESKHFEGVVTPSNSTNWNDSTSPNTTAFCVFIAWDTSVVGDVTITNLKVIEFLDGES